MTTVSTPSLGFVLIFLLFSLLFISNTYKLWFKTDAYYQDIYNSLTRTSYPFKDFFLRRLENRKRWEAEQKVFSLIGLVAVVVANLMVLSAWIGK